LINPSRKYLDFSNDLKELADKIKDYKECPFDRPLIKLIDEYNFTQNTQKDGFKAVF